MRTKDTVVLLVEDNPDHAQLAKSCLSQQSTVGKVIHVSDGESALAYLFNQNSYSDIEKNPRPQLVLLDLRLPRIDGLEILKRIRASNEMASVPVVILSTSDTDSDITEAYQRGASGYAIKPLDYTEFLWMMNDLCSFWLIWNRLPSLTSLPVPSI